MSICEKHRAFAAEWELLGRPQLEHKHEKENDSVFPSCKSGEPIFWTEALDYRIAGDRHWELRRKWLDSGKTLPIECLNTHQDKWGLIDTSNCDVFWHQSCEYREAPVEEITITDVERAKDPGNVSPLEMQIGGDHYKNCKIQPIEYITANNLGFIQGSVIKYITRYKSKNGKQDLEKAKHFIDLLIELEYGNKT